MPPKLAIVKLPVIVLISLSSVTPTVKLPAVTPRKVGLSVVPTA